MKKILFIVLALIVASTPAWALMCKTSQSGNSDECWTQVKLSASETRVVSQGTVLVYDFTSSTGTDDSAFQTIVSTAATDGYRVAGIAQRTIATGDQDMILVRGKGKIHMFGGTTSGDRLFVSTNAGRAVNRASFDVASVASNDKPIAFALETQASTATIDAYITVV